MFILYLFTDPFVFSVVHEQTFVLSPRPLASLPWNADVIGIICVRCPRKDRWCSKEGCVPSRHKVVLDTVGPELQVVNKSEVTISLEENESVVLTHHHARRPPPNCRPSTYLDSPWH
ncbi:hypothetical protein ACQ4PT_021894 [Festuca glaucescens]